MSFGNRAVVWGEEGNGVGLLMESSSRHNNSVKSYFKQKGVT